MNKMQPKEVSWFELYIELKSDLTSRIFALEMRVKELEEANQKLEAASRTRADMRIGGQR